MICVNSVPQAECIGKQRRSEQDRPIAQSDERPEPSENIAADKNGIDGDQAATQSASPSFRTRETNPGMTPSRAVEGKQHDRGICRKLDRPSVHLARDRLHQRWQVSWLAGQRLTADLPGFPADDVVD
jgi:hypothetical protein